MPPRKLSATPKGEPRTRLAPPQRGSKRKTTGAWKARSPKGSRLPDLTAPLVAVFMLTVSGGLGWYFWPEIMGMLGPKTAEEKQRRAVQQLADQYPHAEVFNGQDGRSKPPPKPAPKPAPASVPAAAKSASVPAPPLPVEPPKPPLPAARLDPASMTTAAPPEPPSAPPKAPAAPEPAAAPTDDVPVQIAKATLAPPPPVPPVSPAPEPAVPPSVETSAAAPEPAPAPTLPPQPQPQAGVARALPLDPNKLTTERVAAYQVALERMHFSCGFVDGDVGMRTRRMLRSFQESHGLPVTGELDEATRALIGEPGEPFCTYTVTTEDMRMIDPTPDTWLGKSQKKFLGYNDAWEMLAEKFHCTRDYVRQLNSDVKEVAAGTAVIGPKVFPPAKISKAAAVRIILADTSIQALDANGRILAHFPCSIAKDKGKRPKGELTVKTVAPNPDYLFSPSVQVEAAAKEGITKKIMIPPGPNNPVGLAWIGLSLPGYGMHGTPDPEAISRTQSLGCFRLSNWNAQKLLKMVSIGTPVEVVPPAEAVADAGTP